MKKFLLIICVALLSFACESNEDSPGPGMNWDVHTFRVVSNDWELIGRPDDPNSYYRFVFRVDALNNFIYNNGNVNGYIQLADDDNVVVQTPLPYVQHYENNVGQMWTETYSFDFNPGSVAFYVRYSDFSTSVRPPTSNFRVVLNW